MTFKTEIADLRTLLGLYERATDIQSASDHLREFNAAWNIFVDRYPRRFDRFDRSDFVRNAEQMLRMIEMCQ